jgi:hypothetical protein
MVYQGAEDGAEDYYRQMLCLKRKVPALALGHCDYTAIRVDDANVFAPLRAWQGQVIVPVIHLANGHTHATLKLPVGRLANGAESFGVMDLLAGHPLPGPDGKFWTRGQLGALGVALGPFQVRILEVSPA